MCTTCGCSGTIAPEVVGAGQPGHDDQEGHAHDHLHGYHHTHDHGHGHLHDHDPDHVHEHRHADGTVHAHVHDAPHTADLPGYHHAHDHGHGHLHDHDHVHEHRHADGTVHRHRHDAPHDHGAATEPTAARTIALEREILEKNRLLAERNRGWLEGREVFAVNLMSSPGSGKTTLLERTIRDLSGRTEICVVEGDQDTRLDAERIRAAGARVVQINTGTGCHLDAQMLGHALHELGPPLGSVLFVENVGNLVCPALFDLGESARVVIASTTEGEDKPLKYPHMFRGAELIVLNKIDLLPHLRFEVDRFVAHVRQVNPSSRVLGVSATRGDGLEDWYGWLAARRASARPAVRSDLSQPAQSHR